MADKHYILSSRDARILRDTVRRVRGGSSSQRPPPKRRRGARGGGGSPIIYGWLVANVPASVLNEAAMTNEFGTAGDAIVVANLGDPAEQFEPTLDDGGQRRKMTAINVTPSELRGSTADPVFVQGHRLSVRVGSEDVTGFVIHVTDYALHKGFAKNADQALYHPADKREFKLGGSVCPAPAAGAN